MKTFRVYINWAATLRGRDFTEVEAENEEEARELVDEYDVDFSDYSKNY